MIIYYDSDQESKMRPSFNSKCSENYIEILMTKNFNIPYSMDYSSRTKLLKITKHKTITHSNRRFIWLRLSGGEKQIVSRQAIELYELKCQDWADMDDSFLPDFDSLSHNCFTNHAHRVYCCVEAYNKLHATQYACQNHACPNMVPMKNSLNFSSCCLFFSYSKRISDIAATCDPNNSHVPLLMYLSNLFYLVFENEYEVYACLVGLIKNTNLTYLDKTLTSSKISAIILRYFLKNLCRVSFNYSDLNHPWLKMLYNLDPFKIESNFFDSSENPWVFCDWPVMLFQNMNTWNLIHVIDLFLLRGVKELYKWMLFYFLLLFKIMNSIDFKQTNESFDRLYVNSILVNLIRAESSIFDSIKLIQLVKKLKITNKNITRMTKKIFPILLNRSHLGSCSYPPEFDEQIISIDLKRKWPSTVIDSVEWSTIISWLPDNVQLLSPVVSYSSNIHGCSLNTLYSKSEEYEPILLMIKTECSAIFGGYLAQSLKSRKTQQGYCSSFGTGETFIFSLKPKIKKYSWAVLDKSGSLNSIENTILSHSSSQENKVKKAKKTMNLSSNIKITKICSVFEEEIPILLSDTIFNDKSNLRQIKSLDNSDNSPPIPIQSQSDVPNDIFTVADDTFIAIGGGGGYAIWLDETLITGTSQICSTFLNDPFVTHPHGCFKSLYVEVFRFLDASLCS